MTAVCERAGKAASALVDNVLQSVNYSIIGHDASNSSFEVTCPYPCPPCLVFQRPPAFYISSLSGRLQDIPWSNGLDYLAQRSAAFPWRVVVFCGILYLTLALLMMPKYIAWMKPLRPHRAADYDLVIPISAAMLAMLDVAYLAISLPHASTSRYDKVALYVMFFTQLWTVYRLGKHTSESEGADCALYSEPRVRLLSLNRRDW